ncbi:MAG: conjugal transfer protein TraX [Ruminococcaceae bacterium]|nr:conjugal transfer protein TraX [Oscillospiraceae bacterium]
MKKVLNANAIKIIAIIAMTIDHIAWMLFPGYPTEPLPLALHIIGRITCPVMCYFIAEGYHYTKDINKYTFRLFVFAIISHFPYVFASADFVDWRSFIPFYYGSVLNQTSVMWSLAWGLVMLRVVNSENIKNKTVKTLLIILICLVAFPSDWSCIASLCILAFGTNRGNFKTQMLWMVIYVAMYSTVYFFALDKVYGLMQMAVVLAIPILMLYNGRISSNRTVNKVMKWLFYIYYPLHLLIIALIQYFA